MKKKPIFNDKNILSDNDRALWESQNEILSQRYKTPYDNEISNYKYISPIEAGVANAHKNAFNATPINVSYQVEAAGDSQYNENMPGTMYLGDNYMNDIENYRSNRQGVMAGLFNQTVKLGGKTLNNVIGGLAGFIYGIGDAVISRDASKILDNKFLDMIDGFDKSMNENLPVYKSNDYKNNAWYENMFKHPMMSADGLIDTYSFILGAVGTELLTAGSGTASVAARGASLFNKIFKGGKLLEEGATIASDINKVAKVV